MAGIGWEIGKKTLEALGAPIEQLRGDLENVRTSISRKRFLLASEFLTDAPTHLKTLSYVVALLETSGIIDTHPRDEKLKMAPLVEELLFRTLRDIGCAYTTLVLSRRNLWYYYRKVWALDREKNKLGVPIISESQTNC